jgi:acetyl esterase/lipase
VLSTSGIVYGTGEINTVTPQTFDLLLDLYEPDADLRGHSLPVMIIIHGGGFAGGSRAQSQLVTFAAAFASQGYLAVSIDYRVAPQDPLLSAEVQTLESEYSPFAPKTAMLAAADDTLKAVQWIIDGSAAIHADTSKIGLLGGSAGAITALNVEYALDGYGFSLPAFQVVVDLWGGLGLGYASPTTISASTIAMTEAPIIIVHGTNDMIVNYSHAVAFADAANMNGLPIEFISNAGAGHGFGANDIFTLETSPGSGITQFQRILDFVNVAMLAPDCLRLELTIDNCRI